MKDAFEEFVKSTLSEITRYERETGKRYSFEEEIKKYVSKSHPTRYAFTMTQVPKVGINPQTQYDTPAGVYAYPLNQAFYKKLIEGKLPFADDMPYCNIMRLNFDAGKWLITSSKGLDRSSNADVVDVLKKVNKNGKVVFWEHGKHVNFGNDSKIFDITYFATRNEKRSTAAWTKLLRELGYIGIYDPGNSVIHPNEPSQLVCLDPKAYTWVETYETRAIRKPQPETGLTLRQIKDREFTPEELAQWAKNWNPTYWTRLDMMRARDVLSGYIQVDEDTYKTVMKKMPIVTKAIQYTLLNKNISSDILNGVAKKLFDYIDPGIPQAQELFVSLMTHPKCPPEVWDLFVKNIKNMSSTALSAILSHRNVKPDALRQMMNELTNNESLTDLNYYDLDALTRDILLTLLKNPKMPKDILDQAMNRPEEVSKPYGTSSGPASIKDEIRNVVALNPNTTDNARQKKIVKKLIDDAVDDQDKLDILNDNVLTPPEAIQVLRAFRQRSTSGSYKAGRLHDIIVMILSKTPFSPDVIDTLTTVYNNESKLLSIMQNPNISVKTLRKLKQSPFEDVRYDAQARLGAKRTAQRPYI